MVLIDSLVLGEGVLVIAGANLACVWHAGVLIMALTAGVMA